MHKVEEIRSWQSIQRSVVAMVNVWRLTWTRHKTSENNLSEWHYISNRGWIGAEIWFLKRANNLPIHGFQVTILDVSISNQSEERNGHLVKSNRQEIVDSGASVQRSHWQVQLCSEHGRNGLFYLTLLSLRII